MDYYTTAINRHSMFAHTNEVNPFQSANTELQQLQQFQKTQQQQIEQQRQLALQDSIQSGDVGPSQLSRLFKSLMEEFNQLGAADKKEMRGDFAKVIRNIRKFRKSKTRASLKKAHKSAKTLRSKVKKKLGMSGGGGGLHTQTPNFSQVHPDLGDSSRKPVEQVFKALKMAMGPGAGN